MNKEPSIPSNGAARPNAASEHLLLHVENLSKQYSKPGRTTGRPLIVFDTLNLDVAQGEILAVVGQSGSGKSSLLHLLGALDRPTSGEVWYAGCPLSRMNTAEAARFRNREVGYVWQFHYLLPEFTAVENAAMPLLARGMTRREATALAGSWLEQVGLGDRLHHQAGELSGGEQQRVSIARALVGKPALLLADEPTGDLDEGTSAAIFELLERLHRQQGLTTVLVTHNMALARRCDRVLRLTEGQVHALDPSAV